MYSLYLPFWIDLKPSPSLTRTAYCQTRPQSCARRLIDIGMERMHVPPARDELGIGIGVEEVENGAVDVSQVIAKCVTGVGCSLLELTGEVQLCAQRPPGPDCFRSLPLPPKKFSGRLQVTARHFSDLTKTQPSSSAKTSSLACSSIRPSRQKSVTIEAFVFDENT
jgi:hypothetical protein